jgi:hypothetical protein
MNPLFKYFKFVVVFFLNYMEGIELTRATTELVQHFLLLGDFTSAQKRCFA